MRNTREIAVEYRLSHWAQIMQERSASGLSIKSYCETKGIHQNVYHYWQRKLRQVAYETSTNQSEPTVLSVQSFAEVKLVEAEDTIHQGSGHVIVEVAGCKITATTRYPAETLASLLKALMQPC